jgi:8-oxo-dGTP diphosphatase
MAEKPPTQIAVAIVIDNDRVLIGQRPVGVALAGLWEFPGGKIEAGESPFEAACRECLEEAGIQATAIDMLDETRHAYDHGAVHIYFVRCQVSNPTLEPAPPFRWVNRRELGGHEFPAANARVVQLLLEM